MPTLRDFSFESCFQWPSERVPRSPNAWDHRHEAADKVTRLFANGLPAFAMKGDGDNAAQACPVIVIAKQAPKSL